MESKGNAGKYAKTKSLIIISPLYVHADYVISVYKPTAVQ